MERVAGIGTELDNAAVAATGHGLLQRRSLLAEPAATGDVHTRCDLVAAARPVGQGCESVALL